MKKKFSEKDIQIERTESLYQNFFKIVRYYFRFRLFSGRWSPMVHRDVFHRPNASSVLLYDPRLDKVVLIEQFRIGVIHQEKNPWLYEIVAGVIEGNESPENVAVREAKEEANVDLKESDLQFICDYYPSPGGMSERIYVFYAEIDSTAIIPGVYGAQHENEDIRVHVMSFRRAYKLLSSRKLRNGLSYVAMFWLKINRRKLRKNASL